MNNTPLNHNAHNTHYALNDETSESTDSSENREQSAPLFTILNLVINTAFQQVTVDQELLQSLTGTICRITLRGMPTVDIRFQHGEILLLPKDEQRDVTLLIETDLETLKNLAGTGYAPPGKLKMSGDMGIAQTIQRLAKTVDIDWETILANIIGNVPAYLVTNQGKKFAQWGQYVGNSKAESVIEYLLYEKQILVSTPEWQQLRTETDALLDRVERAHAKVAMLKNQDKKPTVKTETKNQIKPN